MEHGSSDAGVYRFDKVLRVSILSIRLSVILSVLYVRCSMSAVLPEVQDLFRGHGSRYLGARELSLTDLR